jgi:hypothetical protein
VIHTLLRSYRGLYKLHSQVNIPEYHATSYLIFFSIHIRTWCYFETNDVTNV